MKKQLTVALGLAVLATPVFASKARLQALGESTNGSFYINDNRNVFLNPEAVNAHSDLVTYEWGAAGAADTTAAPNAEGGFFKSHGSFNYGVQLGRKLDAVTGFNALNNTAYNSGNPIDLFVGGDAGVKWGAQATYMKGYNDAGTNQKAHVYDLALGATQGNLSGFVKYGVGASSETAGDEIERKGTYSVGGSYKMMGMTAFGSYSTTKFEEESSDDEFKSNAWLLGAGREHKLTDKTVMFTKLNFAQSTTSNNGTTMTRTVPVTVGFEHEVNSWMALRGSVAQNLWSSERLQGGDKRTVANSTIVNAGATLKFGDLNVDGVIGNNAAGTTPAVDGTSAGLGQLRTDSLMSRVSVTYRF